ncbi:MAG: isochorismatase family protein [Actinomycetota bacterium]
MKIDKSESTLLIVDLQARLLPAIEEGATVLENALWLIGIAKRLGVPILVTEQYPQGLGRSASEIVDALPAEAFIEKKSFSAVMEGRLLRAPGADRKQWVVAGAEAHVCVQQTVLDLLASGREVFIVDEAVGSRRGRDKELALQRMQRHGADVVSREMVAFEWLEEADTDIFRDILKGFIR